MRIKQVLLAAIAPAALSFTCVLPALAQPAALVDSTGLIRVYEAPTPQSPIRLNAQSGEQVEVISETQDRDGFTWYRVRFNRTGETGWVRRAQVSFGSSGSPSSQVPTAVLRACTNRALIAFNTYTTNIEIIRSRALGNGLYSVSLLTKDTRRGAECQATRNGRVISWSLQSEGAGNNPSNRPILSFQTRTYSVKIFSRDGQLRMNLFNQKTSVLTLDAVRVQTRSTNSETTYWFDGRDYTYQVFFNRGNGQKRLRISGFGEVTEETGS